MRADVKSPSAVSYLTWTLVLYSAGRLERNYTFLWQKPFRRKRRDVFQALYRATRKTARMIEGC